MPKHPIEIVPSNLADHGVRVTVRGLEIHGSLVDWHTLEFWRAAAHWNEQIWKELRAATPNPEWHRIRIKHPC